MADEHHHIDDNEWEYFEPRWSVPKLLDMLMPPPPPRRRVVPKTRPADTAHVPAAGAAVPSADIAPGIPSPTDEDEWEYFEPRWSLPKLLGMPAPGYAAPGRTAYPQGTAGGSDYVDEDGYYRPRRSLAGLIVLLAAVIVVILLLLMLRGCASDGSLGGGSGSVDIEVVEQGKPVEGLISVWVDKDAKLNLILKSAGVESAKTVDMGGGRYVVEVEPGKEAGTVKSLGKKQGVRDAGLVYE